MSSVTIIKQPLHEEMCMFELAELMVGLDVSLVSIPEIEVMGGPELPKPIDTLFNTYYFVSFSGLRQAALVAKKRDLFEKLFCGKEGSIFALPRELCQYNP